jgi:surface antigen
VERRVRLLSALRVFTLILFIILVQLTFIRPVAASGDDYPLYLKNRGMDTILDPWKEWNRECTSFVAWRLHARDGFEMPFHSNAINWVGIAKRLGYKVNSTPAVGSVAWFGYGHVAWVEAVFGSNVTIEQYNANRRGTYSRSIIPAHSARYIHFKDIPPPPVHQDVNGDGRADIVIVKDVDQDTRRIEADVLSGKTGYTGWLSQSQTAAYDLKYTDQLLMGDVNGDGHADLVIAETFATGSGKIAIHVLSGATNYTSWLMHASTAAEYLSASDQLLMGDVNGDGKADLIIISSGDTDSGKTEAHILDGATNYTTWLYHTATPADYLNSYDKALMGDVNGDGKADMIIVTTQKTNSGKVEVNVLSGATGYATWLAHGITTLSAGNNFNNQLLMGDVNGDGHADLVIAKTGKTESGKVELNVLDGAANYSVLLGNSVTVATFSRGGSLLMTP